MASWLRETVTRLGQAADRVEGTAGAMAEVSSSVSAVTADQVRGIRQATSSMEAIVAQGWPGYTPAPGEKPVYM